MQVYFSDIAQPVIDQAMNIKCKEVEVINVFLDVEPIQFNKGFYSVDMTFYFRVGLDVYTGPSCLPTSVCGLATFCKKVILYGSEGNVKTFNSLTDRCNCEPVTTATNLPKASVQVVDPICLSCKLIDMCVPQCEVSFSVPPCLQGVCEGNYTGIIPTKRVTISLGLFSIVQLSRDVQMMIPAYDFCIPDKGSVCTDDDPCELFKKIKFPTSEFFPPRLSEMDCEE